MDGLITEAQSCQNIGQKTETKTERCFLRTMHIFFYIRGLFLQHITNLRCITFRELDVMSSSWIFLTNWSLVDSWQLSHKYAGNVDWCQWVHWLIPAGTFSPILAMICLLVILMQQQKCKKTKLVDAIIFKKVELTWRRKWGTWRWVEIAQGHPGVRPKNYCISSIQKKSKSDRKQMLVAYNSKYSLRDKVEGGEEI